MILDVDRQGDGWAGRWTDEADDVYGLKLLGTRQVVADDTRVTSGLRPRKQRVLILCPAIRSCRRAHESFVGKADAGLFRGRHMLGCRRLWNFKQAKNGKRKQQLGAPQSQAPRKRNQCTPKNDITICSAAQTGRQYTSSLTPEPSFEDEGQLYPRRSWECGAMSHEIQAPPRL